MPHGQYNAQKDPEMVAYYDAFQLSVDYVNPHWELAIRLYALWRGKVPWQLDGTFSKIMLQIGHGMVEDRKPKLFENIFGVDNPVSLKATEPLYETYVDQAEAWLNHLLFDESKINMRYSIGPTLTSSLIMGNGYRMPCVRYIPEKPGGKATKAVLTSKDIDFFQILPAPNGGLVNTMDSWEYEAVDYFFYVDWMTDRQIEALSRYDGFNKEAFVAMKKYARDTEGGIIEHTYREKFNIIGGILYNDEHNWRTRLYDIPGLGETSGRRRVVHWFRRDKWIIVVQDQFKVYEGNPPMGGGLLPLVKYAVVPDMKNWFGIGTLEMSEDMIIALIMNFNYRMDHLAQVLFPTKYIRDDVFGSKTESDFYDRPYATHKFPTSVQKIGDAIWYDRAPEIDQQTFMEEDRLRTFLQEVSGMSNYSKGMGGSGTLANETATGITSLIREAQGRINAESQNLEREGLAQECRQLLVLGDQHVNDDEIIRVPQNKSGFPWTRIDPEAISDRFTVVTHGTSKRALEEAQFQKMLALLPMFLNDPYHQPYELRKQVHEIANVFPDADKLLLQPEPQAAQQMGQEGSAPQSTQPGGAASAMDIRQQNRSTSQRNTVGENGKSQPASPVPVGA